MYNYCTGGDMRASVINAADIMPVQTTHVSVV